MSFLNKIISAKEKDNKLKKKAEGKSEAKAERQEEARPKTEGKIIAGVIRASHVTEKSAVGSEKGTYIFRVAPKANKIDVRRAVEARYSVHVERVNMLNTSGKERRRGKQIGWKPGFKKAMVTLQKGETIEMQ